MRSPLGIRRVILVVLDGLRPDAIDAFNLTTLRRLQEAGATTRAAQTITPSVTAAAMGSLLTGVAPAHHGVLSDRFHIPRPTGPIDHLPHTLEAANFPTTGFVTDVPILFRGIAARIARHVGFSTSRFVGTGSADMLAAAERTIATQRRGLIFMHWPDADRAGHEHGWMSPQYGGGAQSMDASLSKLVRMADIPYDIGTMLVLLSDHGGGGVVANDHDSEHPVDKTIFITLVGRQIVPSVLREDVTLLDVPPTILWALGVRIPASYECTPIVEAFRPRPELVAAVV